MERKLDIVVSAMAAKDYDFAGSAVVVIDVLRATTSMLYIFESGGSAIYPVGGVDEARLRKEQMPNALLCGERKGLAPAGFDLGNSPVDFRDSDLTGKEVVLTTTNGTQAVMFSRNAVSLTAATIGNAASSARYLLHEAKSLPVYLLCAGTKGAFSIEDFYCAGLIASLVADNGGAVLTDIAWAAATLSNLPVEKVVNTQTCRHLKSLSEIGFSRDVELCLEDDANLENRPVPVYDGENNRFISLSV